MAALRIKQTADGREGLVTTLQRTRLAGVSAQGVGASDLASCTADGSLLATADPFAGSESSAAQRTVALWDTRDVVHPRRLATLTGHAERVHGFAFSADGRLLATIGNDGREERYRSSLALWDLSDRAHPRRVLHWKGLRDAAGAAFSRDGRTMAVVSGRANGTLQLWDIGKPSAPRRLTAPLPATDSDSVAFSPDGNTLVTGSGWFTASDSSLDPGTITHSSGWTAWDIRDVRHPTAVSRRKGFGGAAFGRTAPLLAVTHGRTVTLWDLHRPRSPRRLAAFEHKDQVEAAAFSPDGRRPAVSVLDGTAFLRDVGDPSRPGEPALLGGHGTRVHAVAFGRDGRTVRLADVSGFLTGWRAASRVPARTATLRMDSAGLNGSAFSPDGRTLAVAASGGEVWLWDTSDPAHPRRRKRGVAEAGPGPAVRVNLPAAVTACRDSRLSGRAALRRQLSAVPGVLTQP
ncbi:PD40 domain-containing protein [Streptomyces sp. F63]|uniref:WD40 repeat domain-containing protein n=1 Tax=Streptomyces sp. F63 TaxID=2824887 RepID=UPI001B3933BC|nr:PD40 domain-containing protein [Streptomyces sp. F63]MBQ0985601.1 PD40 domain-containing protein [Streptomyces sp. F63]